MSFILKIADSFSQVNEEGEESEDDRDFDALAEKQRVQGRRQPPKYGVDKQAKRTKIWGVGAGPQKIFLGPRPLECRKTPFRVPRNALFWIK